MKLEEITSLDELFSVARTHLAADRNAQEIAKRAPRHQRGPDAAPTPDALYTNPDNWELKRHVALIHEESQTLLGNFAEWRHKTDAGARKLIRTEAPVALNSMEYVEGDWWLAKELVAEVYEPWHTKREAVVHLVFPSMQVHAPDTPVIVHLSYGGIARVELEAATTFAQLSGASEQLLQLPAGVNVLPMMSQDSKIALRMEISE